MVLSGADDEEPEPGRPGPQDGVPSWPAAGLPSSFGQRSIEGERPAVTPPVPGSGYGGFRPLGSLPPSGPPPGSLPPSGPPPGSLPPGGPARRQAGADRPAPEDVRHETGDAPGGPGGHWAEPGGYRDEQGAPWEEPGRGWAAAAGPGPDVEPG